MESNFPLLKENKCSSEGNTQEITTEKISVVAVKKNLPIVALTYIEERLYLAAYTAPPDQNTDFPYPAKSSSRSPSKRSSRAVNGPSPVKTIQKELPVYFSVDETLLYNAFHHDFGPLHIGHLYRFAVHLHDILGAPENKGKPVVFWSKADARSKFKFTFYS